MLKLLLHDFANKYKRLIANIYRASIWLERLMLCVKAIRKKQRKVVIYIYKGV